MLYRIRQKKSCQSALENLGKSTIKWPYSFLHGIWRLLGTCIRRKLSTCYVIKNVLIIRSIKNYCWCLSKLRIQTSKAKKPYSNCLDTIATGGVTLHYEKKESKNRWSKFSAFVERMMTTSQLFWQFIECTKAISIIEYYTCNYWL